MQPKSQSLKNGSETNLVRNRLRASSMKLQKAVTVISTNQQRYLNAVRREQTQLIKGQFLQKVDQYWNKSTDLMPFNRGRDIAIRSRTSNRLALSKVKKTAEKDRELVDDWYHTPADTEKHHRNAVRGDMRFLNPREMDDRIIERSIAKIKAEEQEEYTVYRPARHGSVSSRKVSLKNLLAESEQNTTETGDKFVKEVRDRLGSLPHHIVSKPILKASTESTETLGRKSASAPETNAVSTPKRATSIVYSMPNVQPLPKQSHCQDKSLGAVIERQMKHKLSHYLENKGNYRLQQHCLEEYSKKILAALKQVQLRRNVRHRDNHHSKIILDEESKKYCLIDIKLSRENGHWWRNDKGLNESGYSTRSRASEASNHTDVYGRYSDITGDPSRSLIPERDECRTKSESSLLSRSLGDLTHHIDRYSVANTVPPKITESDTSIIEKITCSNDETKTAFRTHKLTSNVLMHPDVDRLKENFRTGSIASSSFRSGTYSVASSLLTSDVSSLESTPGNSETSLDNVRVPFTTMKSEAKFPKIEVSKIKHPLKNDENIKFDENLIKIIEKNAMSSMHKRQLTLSEHGAFLNRIGGVTRSHPTTDMPKDSPHTGTPPRLPYAATKRGMNRRKSIDVFNASKVNKVELASDVMTRIGKPHLHTGHRLMLAQQSLDAAKQKQLQKDETDHLTPARKVEIIKNYFHNTTFTESEWIIQRNLTELMYYYESIMNNDLEKKDSNRKILNKSALEREKNIEMAERTLLLTIRDSTVNKSPTSAKSARNALNTKYLRIPREVAHNLEMLCKARSIDADISNGPRNIYAALLTPDRVNASSSAYINLWHQ